jgi:C4-dicarboxylate-specific signal transduction histidine kinase
VLHRNTERAGRIAHSLRSFARQAAGERAPVNLNSVVDETLLPILKLLTTDGIEVAIVLDRTLPSILGTATSSIKCC